MAIIVVTFYMRPKNGKVPNTEPAKPDNKKTTPLQTPFLNIKEEDEPVQVSSYCGNSSEFRY